MFSFRDASISHENGMNLMMIGVMLDLTLMPIAIAGQIQENYKISVICQNKLS